MAWVQRMHGEGCRYFFRGRCTRTADPWDSEQAKCSLLEARRKVGARTMDRLERLARLGDPADREVARRHLIKKNLEAITRLSCEQYVPSPKGELCAHQHLVYCLLLMPACTGRCEHFLARRPSSTALGGKR